MSAHNVIYLLLVVQLMLNVIVEIRLRRLEGRD
jgi:hypothetical protein